MRQRHTSWTGMCALGTILAFTSGCSFADELLSVQNPDEIQLEDVNDIALFDVLLAGVIDNFQGAFDDPFLEFGSYMTDEVLSGLNWEGHARTNQRITSYLEGPTEGLFEQISRAHITGKNTSELFREWQAGNPEDVGWRKIDFEVAADFDPGIATALVFAGFSLVIEGEFMCQGVISYDPDDPSGTVLEQVDIYAAAIPFLIDAEATASGAGEDDLMNLARVGLARANLGRGNWVDAANWGGMVPAGFEWQLEYVETSGGRNPLQNTSHGGNFTLGIHPNFTGQHPSFGGTTGNVFLDNDIIDVQTDPRIQHALRDRTGHNGLTPLYKLFQGLRWGEYTGETLAPTSVACPLCTGIDEDDFEDFLIANRPTNIVLADYLDAQHHMHEGLAMQGGNDAAVLAFVNARRTFGNQAVVALAGDPLITELRNQRARDLFMGGFRLGDLRRWTRFDAGNGPFAGGSYFPTGPHVNEVWGDYGIWTCYPIPLSEYEGNVNLSKPANPLIPPGI